LFLITICFINSYDSKSQLTTTPNGGNFRATVSEQVGLSDVKVSYSRPGVKGREGKIFGTQIAHYGFIDQGFGPSKAAPWRAGANECTSVTVSKDVQIEGKTLPAGTYGLFLGLSENEVTVIFSKNSTAWGSYTYSEAEDVLRVNVKPIKGQPLVERLKYEFSNQTESSAELSLLWEYWKIPMKISVDVVQQQLASFRDDIRTDKGFSSQAFQQAAQYCLNRNVNLEEGLKWSESAINESFIGEKTFGTLSLKSKFLDKMGKAEEATATMKQAVAIGSANEVHGYGRQLMAAKKLPEALEVFKLNESKNPTEYAPKVGMTRILSAMGKYKDALKFAKLAQTLVGDNAQEKANIEGIIKKLMEGKDVN
jgi:hypothetical protein